MSCYNFRYFLGLLLLRYLSTKFSLSCWQVYEYDKYKYKYYILITRMINFRKAKLIKVVYKKESKFGKVKIILSTWNLKKETITLKSIFKVIPWNIRHDVKCLFIANLHLIANRIFWSLGNSWVTRQCFPSGIDGQTLIILKLYL